MAKDKLNYIAMFKVLYLNHYQMGRNSNDEGFVPGLFARYLFALPHFIFFCRWLKNQIISKQIANVSVSRQAAVKSSVNSTTDVTF